MMNHLLRLFIKSFACLIFVLPVMLSYGQAPLSKKAYQSQLLYNKGRLQKAYKKSNASLKSLTKHNQEKELQAQTSSIQGMILQAMGRHQDFEVPLLEAINIAKTLPHDTGHVLLKCYLGAAEAYFYYGHLRKANEMVQKARENISTLNQTSSLILETNLLSARIYAKLGLLNKADSTVKIILPAIAYKTQDLKNKKQKLSKKEKEKIRSLFAWSKALEVEVAYEKGLYYLADSLARSNNVAIKLLVGKRSPMYASNLQYLGKMQEDAKEFKKASRLYEQSLIAVKNRRDMHYFDAFQKAINERIIKDEFKSTPRKAFTQFDRNTHIYFKKGNVYNSRKEILVEWFTAKKYEKNKVEERLHAYLIQQKSFPRFHPNTLEAQKVFLINQTRERNFASIEDSLLASVAVAKELYGTNAPVYHLHRLNLADFYFKKVSSFKKAEEIYLESFVGVISKEWTPNHKDYVWYLHDLGALYTESESFSKATPLLEKATLQAKQNFKADYRYARVAGSLAHLYIATGNYDKAKGLIQESEAILDKGNKEYYTSEYAVAYQNISEGYATYGVFDKAVQNLEKAEKIMSRNLKKGLDPAENSSLDEMAGFYIQTGDYKEAESLLKQSIASKEASKGINTRDLIKPLNLLGNVYFHMGDYGQSETLLNRSLKLTSTFSNDSSLQYAEGLKTLRKVYMAFGDYDKAERACKKEIQITSRILGTSNLHLAEALEDLAVVIYQKRKNIAECRSILNNANTLLKNGLGADNPYYINSLKMLALFEIEAGNFVKADSLIKISEKYWEGKLGKHHIYASELLGFEADLCRAQGKFTPAIAYYKLAAKQIKKDFGVKHPAYINYLSKMAKTYYASGDYMQSLEVLEQALQTYNHFIQKYFPVLSFGEKSKYWDLIKGDYEFFNSLGIKLGDKHPTLIGKMYDYEMETKGLLLSNSIKVRQRILNSGNLHLVNKFNKWTEKNEFYTKALSYSHEERKELGVDLGKLEKEIEELEKELSTSSEEFAISFENKYYGWRDVRKTLKENEAAVEIIRFRNYKKTFTDSVIYAALIVTPTSTSPELVILKEGHLMEKRYVKYYRNAIKYKNEDKLSHSVFWKQIEEKVGKANTIYFSNEGVYNQINLETLVDVNGKSIIENYNIHLVSNTKDLVLNKLYTKKKLNKELEKTVTLIGNPQFYTENSTVTTKSIRPLQGAEAEVKDIAAMYKSNNWKTSLLTYNNAEEEKLKTLENGRIMHFATHGFFYPDTKEGLNENSILKASQISPLFRTGLLLKSAGEILDKDFSVSNVNSQNGILTAYEAMNLNLDKTEVVTLSACETGLGDVQIGENVAGLQRAFLVAGADFVVMSLFKVNDDVTQELMVTFYKKWLESGDKRKAFIEAKKEIKSQYPEPIYWGAFVTVGN